MKEETLAKVQEETKDWAYPAELPETLHGFTLDREVHVHDDLYDLFSYRNPELHKSVTACFHEETHEYKLMVTYGLIHFYRIEFITAKLDVFESMLRKELDPLIDGMVTFHPESLSSIVLDKKILDWEMGKNLPDTLEGFYLFVRPTEPVKITNGSYILIDYVDFELESSFTEYYNIFRDEFFGEARIWNIPDVNYEFDAKEFHELENILHEKLIPRLRQVRSWAVAKKDEVHYT